ncbi:MAG TPA: hypothetical protein VMT39_01465 [Candidatus Bathyarchaeia archaeon]|nr:hypothetical protein [Candidatus Bathyarchaeia archaeon]
MLRRSSFTFAILIALSCFASADLKITTRTTMQGHTTEGTVYIKGARERREMSFGGRSGSVTITQCDQKRLITVMGNQCMVMSMGGSGETACPPAPSGRDIARAMAGGELEAPRKGGVVTISRTSTDTGERQDMFGYKARHIKSTMTMESSPDACNQSHMKMETDGWYADLSAGFSCADESYRAMACGGPGGKPGCTDRIVVKGGGSGAELGYPMKQTTTMTSEHGTFTMTTEVIALSNTSLEAPLFEMPPGCKVMDMSAMMGGASSAAHAEPSAPAPAAAPAAAAKPAAAAAPSAPPVAPKTAGVVRVGVVKIKDMTGQSLPTDNLRLNLLSEIERNKMEVVPLVTDAPHPDVVTEARAKQCDYIVYTVPTALKDPNSGGLPPNSLPKGVTLDPAKYQAVTAVTLYKVDNPQPELKDVPVAADANQFAVDAVMATFAVESDKIAQQVADDAHPKPAAKTTKPAAKTAPKAGATATKPK